MSVPGDRRRCSNTSVSYEERHEVGKLSNQRGGLRMTKLPRLAKKRLDDELRQDAKDAATTQQVKDVKDVWELFDLHPEFGPARRPTHLAPYVDMLTQALNVTGRASRVRIVFSAPPQHMKSISTLMGLTAACIVSPGKQHVYVTYNQTRARFMRNELCLKFLRPLGIKYHASGMMVKVFTKRGTSTIMFTSVSGALTGYSCTGIAVVDDPIKDMNDAASSTMRKKVESFFDAVLLQRGMALTSIVVMMTRWAHNDIAGTLVKRKDRYGNAEWRYINLKAICENKEEDPLHREVGQELCPSWLLGVTREETLDTQARNPRLFYAMWQGTPSPEGQKFFLEPTTYDQVPNVAMVVSYGIDAAYALKRRSDWSVIVRLLTDPTTNITYVDRVIRKQCTGEAFAGMLRSLQDEMMGKVYWYVGGQEGFTGAELLKVRGVRRIECMPAVASKQTRAQDAADAWNIGQLVVPREQTSDMSLFIDEVVNFTGDQRYHDDCVDALAAAFLGVKKRSAYRPVAVTRGNTVMRERSRLFAGSAPQARFKTGEEYERHLLSRSSMDTRRRAI